MARKTPSRLELRKQAEAAESLDPKGAKTKKKAAKKKTTARPRRTKDKTPERKRLVWAIFNSNMKEEARFPYEEREAAEAKLELLKSKGKKLYFIQPIKELIVEAPPPAEEVEAK